MIIPPINIVKEYSGSQDADNYVLVGKIFADKFRPFIQPGDRVLEVGCGCARIAQALESFNIRYDGFDVVKEAIDWCQTLRIPDFNFRWVDLYNSQYNPSGKTPASEFIFPYADHSFDFVFLTSVFTHVQPEVVQHYISQIKRVLKPDKYCLATFFLVEDGKRERSDWKWHKRDDFWIVDPGKPDAIVGYEEAWVRNLMPVEKIDFCFQDTVLYRNAV